MRTSSGSHPYRSYPALLAILAMLGLSPASALADDSSEQSSDDTAESSGEASEDSGTPADEEPPAEESAAADPQPAPATEPASPVEAAPAPQPAAEPAAAQTAPARPVAPVVGYDKGFFIASPDEAFKITLNGRVQARFSFENSAGNPRGNEAQFSLPRVRIKFKGHAFDKRVTFALQMAFDKGGVSLKDALVDFNIIDRKLMVQVGQFKRPFSRQQLASSEKHQFVDRAITDKEFEAGRDLGIMLHSHKKLPFEYAVGVFNGTGDKGQLAGDVSVDPSTGEGEITSGKFSNVPDLVDPMVVARVGWHSQDFDGYAEGDYKGSDFGIGIGGGVLLDFDSDDDDDSAIRAGIDYALAVRGLSSTGGVYLATAQDGEGFGDQRFDVVAFHVQAGYVIKGRVEPVVRYARIMPAGDGGDRQEILGGVNVFFYGHNLKWQTDFGVLTEQADGDDAVDFRARTQVQLSF